MERNGSRGGRRATRPGEVRRGDVHGWRLGMIAGVGFAVAGALTVAPAAFAAPPGTGVAITAALSTVANGKMTLTFTPKISSGTGAYVAVFAQGKGSTLVLIPQTRETGALTSGTQASYVGLPINVSNGTSFKNVTAYEQANYNKAVLVAVYAQPSNGSLLPPPGPVLPRGPSGHSGHTSVGGGTTGPQLPKTGAGPAMEVLGGMLLLGGAVLAVVRPKRQGS